MSEASHNRPSTITVALPDEAATLALGRALAAGIRPGAIVHLSGPLGAGKTTLVRGLLGGLGHAGPVRSPTWTVVEPYTVSKLDFYHIDFYRFTSSSEPSDSGLREYFDGRSVCLIEWPERAGGAAGAPDLLIELSLLDQGRIARITACSESALDWLRNLDWPS
jgi:tRNA threonylcarbamoyladenosine biosynthesis protein TsaE